MNRDIGIIVRLFANGPEDRCSIKGRVIPKTQRMVLDAALLNTQHYKVRIKGKVVQSREWSSAPLLHLSVVAIEKGAFGSPSIRVAHFTYLKDRNTFIVGIQQKFSKGGSQEHVCSCVLTLECLLFKIGLCRNGWLLGQRKFFST